MTPKPPKPPWRGRNRRGEDGQWRVVLPGHRPGDLSCDGCLAERYTATARIGRDERLLAVEVTDRQSGAIFGWTARGNHVSIEGIPADATDAEWEQLRRDGREIVGLARKQSGGPARGTGVTVEDLVKAAVRLRRPDGWPSEEDVADDKEVARSVRQVQRISATIPGDGKPWERVLALAKERLQAIEESDSKP
jgi:hypothetical protein